MRKHLHVFVTVLVIAIVSRFIIRIVDATVQIDDDIGVLLLLVGVVDVLIGVISYRLYHHADK